MQHYRTLNCAPSEDATSKIYDIFLYGQDEIGALKNWHFGRVSIFCGTS